MPQVCWTSGPKGAYWIDVALGNRDLLLLIDVGLVDPNDRVGIVLESWLYDRLRQGGMLANERYEWYTGATGNQVMFETGEATAQLIDPRTRARIGPLVRVDVGRGSDGVPSRVGVAFFHRLTGCRVLWDLDRREWCVEYP